MVILEFPIKAHVQAWFAEPRFPPGDVFPACLVVNSHASGAERELRTPITPSPRAEGSSRWEALHAPIGVGRTSCSNGNFFSALPASDSRNDWVGAELAYRPAPATTAFRRAVSSGSALHIGSTSTVSVAVK